MNFKSRDDLRNFIQERLFPLQIEFGERHKMYLFDYYGKIKNLAEKLKPEIVMEIHPDAEEWASDEEDSGMYWESENLSIDADPLDAGVFMVMISEQ
ncbi:hypothetical protein [Morganella psychrotolerans]|uniref:hypothetical protein n=1 Tax=Morganella psychrotolerans TaxID=368603 RepID=UPI0039B051D6